MTMTTDGLTLREQAEEIGARYKASKAQLEGWGDRATDDDHKAHAQLATELHDAVEAWQAAEVKANQAAQNSARGEEALATLEGIRSRAADSGSMDGLDRSQAFSAPPRDFTRSDRVAVVSDEYTKALDTEVKADGKWREGGNVRLFDNINMFGNKRMNIVTGNSEDYTGSPVSSGGVLLEPDHLPGVVDLAEFRPVTVLDLFTQLPVNSDAFDWIELTAKTNNAAFVAEATSAGGLDSAGHTDAVTDAAGGLKPFSNFTLNKQTSVLELIAHLEAITMKAASFAPQLMTITEQFLREGLRLKIEDSALFGNGTSPELRGLFNTTAPYTLNVFDMSTNSVTDRLVAVARAIALVMTTAREIPTALLVNPLDWYSENFALSQDGQQQFRLGNPFGTTIASQSLWGLRVVMSEAIPQGTQYVGDFSQVMYATRGGTMVELSRSHADFFARNLLALRAEQYAGLGVRKPLAVCAIVA